MICTVYYVLCYILHAICHMLYIISGMLYLIYYVTYSLYSIWIYVFKFPYIITRVRWIHKNNIYSYYSSAVLDIIFCPIRRSPGVDVCRGWIPREFSHGSNEEIGSIWYTRSQWDSPEHASNGKQLDQPIQAWNGSRYDAIILFEIPMKILWIS